MPYQSPARGFSVLERITLLPFDTSEGDQVFLSRPFSLSIGQVLSYEFAVLKEQAREATITVSLIGADGSRDDIGSVFFPGGETEDMFRLRGLAGIFDGGFFVGASSHFQILSAAGVSTDYRDAGVPSQPVKLALFFSPGGGNESGLIDGYLSRA